MQALDTCGCRVQMLRGRVLWRSRHLAIHMWMASQTNLTQIMQAMEMFWKVAHGPHWRGW